MSIAHFSISACIGCVSVFVGVCIIYTCMFVVSCICKVCVYKLVVNLVLQETCLTHYIPADYEKCSS